MKRGIGIQVRGVLKHRVSEPEEDRVVARLMVEHVMGMAVYADVGHGELFAFHKRPGKRPGGLSGSAGHPQRR
ncbi:hypothetical protein GCM10028895_49800 [Pontibacter rugosus]